MPVIPTEEVKSFTFYFSIKKVDLDLVIVITHTKTVTLFCQDYREAVVREVGP